MNLVQRKIHLWRAIAWTLLCVVATWTPLVVVARLKGDVAAAQAAFMRARAQLEEELQIHPDDMHLVSDLGLIDAALGRKEEALNEGRRAIELAPNAQEAMRGPHTKEGFA